MPEMPIHDDAEFDHLLRDAGARMRAATKTVQPPAIRPTDSRETTRRWIVPVAIVAATAAAIAGAVWIVGPATEAVREVPADTGVVPTPDSADSSLPVVAPIDSAPSSVTDPPIATGSGAPVVTITEADFDRAGGMCIRLVADLDSADACLTNRQLQDTPTWTVTFAEQAFEVTLGRLDPEGISATAIDDVCGYAPSALTQARWLNTSCEPDSYFWFVAAPEEPGDESTTYVVPPRTGETIALEPIESALPDGFVAYHAEYEEFDTNVECLIVASFPDPWREACVSDTFVPRVLVPAGGSVFVVEVALDFKSVEVHDIADASIPIAGCTSPISDMAALLDSSVMIAGVACAGDSAMVTVLAVLLHQGPPDGAGYPMERDANGKWSTIGGGTSYPCDQEAVQSACEAFGLGAEDDLMSARHPIPPAALIGADAMDQDPVDVTADVRDVIGGARIADEVAAAVVAQFGTPDGGEGREPVVAVDAWIGLVTVDITLLDDSTSLARYAVWYRGTENDELRVEQAFRIYRCARGVAAPDMCV